MNRLYSPLRRFLDWFAFEHLTAFGMLFYGGHTLAAWLVPNHPAANSAFATILPSGPGRHVETLLFVALPLLSGGALQTYGLMRRAHWAIALGGLAGFFVFVTALASCACGNPFGTGLPAYVVIVSLYLFLSLCRSLRIEWIPVAAA